MNQMQYRVAWPPFTPGVIGLAITFFVIWIGAVVVPQGHSLAATWLALSREGILELRIWTVVTHAFYHLDFFGVFFSALAVWLFGGELERSWGPRRWWTTIATSIVAGGLLVLLTMLVAGDHVMLGFHAPIMTLITAYCRRYWTRELRFFIVPMTGKTMFLFFAGISLVLGALSSWIVIPAELAGIAVGWLAGDSRGLNLRDLKTRFRLWRARRRLKVVRSPESDKPNGKAKSNGTDRKYMN